MKRKFFALGLLVLPLLASCTKDDVKSPESDTVRISANLENGRLWKEGDEVLINGASYTISDGAGKSSATIDGVKAAERYCGAYDFGSGSISGQTLKFSVPSTQTPGHTVINPMAASNTNTVLTFKHVLGTLRFSLSGEPAKITKVALSTSDGTRISGEAIVNLNFAGSPALEMSSDAGTSIQIELGEGIEVGSGSFDVQLPAGSYSSLVMTAFAADGNVMTAKEVPSVEVKRGETASVAVVYEPDAEPPAYIKATLENDFSGAANAWNKNSVIYVNGLPATLYSGEGSAEGTFGPVTASEEGYYVSTSSASAGAASSHMRIDIPSIQTYGKAIPLVNPSAGKATGTAVSLRYIAGAVSVKLSGRHEIREVELLSKSSTRLSGTGVIDLDVDDFALSLNADAKNSVTVDCGSGVEADNGVTFTFVVPAGSYTDGFSVIATDSKGLVWSNDIPALEVKRNELTNAGSFEWASDGSGDNDLSIKGYANCYMVYTGGNYSFDTKKVDNSTIRNIAKADWLWASKVGGSNVNELISDVKYENGKISFTATDNKGNALIAAFDDKGEIVWSWHIWLTDMPQTLDYENNPIYQSGGKTDGFYVMDRNLGATGTSGDEAFGLFYQWGRKDPFIGGYESEKKEKDGETVVDVEPFSGSDKYIVRNTAYSQAVWETAACTKEIGSVEYATAHPMLFIYAGENSNAANWVMKENVSYDIWWDEDKTLWTPLSKSVYDPCPVGYQTPKNKTFDLKNCAPEWFANDGVRFTLSEGVTTWFPYQGYRSAHSDDKGALIYTRGDNGQVEVWTSHYSTAEYAYSLLVSSPAVLNYDNTDPWANGLNVRCVKAYSK